MLKVTQFIVPDTAFDELYEAPETIKAMVQAREWDARYGDEQMASSPLVSGTLDYVRTQYGLDYLLGKGAATARDVTRDYQLLRTNAPLRYDHVNVIGVGTMTGDHGPERLVVVPKAQLEYQCGRYSSGLFAFTLCD